MLITSAINVAAAHTALIDPTTRLELTLKGIEQWRKTQGVSKVIVCDGSGFDLTTYIQDDRPSISVPCEVIVFQNDIKGVQDKGKGYGEGEIIKYALFVSQLLKDEVFFAKCTGRLFVENFKDCFAHFNGSAAFDFYGKLKPTQIDTRFYMVSRDFYSSNLMNAHLAVNDTNGYYLEHAFRDELRKLHTYEYVMYPTPRISGRSASMDILYKQNHLKERLRDLRSLAIQTALLG